MSSKTVSGHMGSGFSLEHNNRDYIAKNVDVGLEKNNTYYVAAGKPTSTEGVRFATIEEIYKKVFEPAWKEFQARQRSDRKSPYDSYLEEIKAKRAEEEAKLGTAKNKVHKTKAVAYETIFQIGNQEDTNIKNHAEDADKAAVVLDDFADHLLRLPYVHVVTTKELADPAWEPPGKAGLLLVNLTQHGDEPDGCRHSHMTVIPYFRSERGQSIQTGLGKTFEALGYKSAYAEKLDENGNKIPKKTKGGAYRTDKKGNVIYEKENTGAGAYDWIEEQKRYIEVEMKWKYGWDRDYQGERATPYHLDTPEYKAQREKEKLAELKADIALHEEVNEELEGTRQRLVGAVAELSQLRNEAEYYAQVEQNDIDLQTLEDNIVRVSKTIEAEGVEEPARRSIMQSVLDALASLIELLRIQIHRVQLFEKLAKRLRLSEGVRQEKTLNDILANATERSEEQEAARAGKTYPNRDDYDDLV